MNRVGERPVFLFPTNPQNNKCMLCPNQDYAVKPRLRKITTAVNVCVLDSHQACFKVAPELRRLVALHLSVLHRTPAQILVQLGDVDGGGGLLVLGRGGADPVMDVHGLSRTPSLTYLSRVYELNVFNFQKKEHKIHQTGCRE